MDISDYSQKTVKELIEVCKEKKLVGYSGKKREDIITILNNEITKIHMRIQDHHKKWISYIYSIKIEEEMNSILHHNNIFDKRLNLLFQILHVY